MSLQPLIIQQVPEDTARVARAAFPKGNPYLRLYDELGPLYADQQFAALFPTRGQPGLSPAQLAVVTVLQFAERLSDRQAADAVRGRIDWKYVLGLPLEDAGFDASVLSEFRARLLAGAAEALLLTTLLERCRALKLLKARGRQRTDSTHVVAAIHALNRVELVGETLRHALNVLATVAPDWLRGVVPSIWHDRYDTRLAEYYLPAAEPARQALAEQLGADGRYLLEALHAPTAPAWLREVPAVGVLRRVWLQQYHAPDEGGVVRWRETTDIPPAAQHINSPHDPEARYSLKRDTVWTGYKVHLTETCDADAPHLLTDVQTTPATTPDCAVTGAIHASLAAAELLPATHFVDGGYVDGGHLATSRREHGIDLVGPALADNSWQARAGQGFDAASFTLDWAARRATCPQGHPSVKWSETHDKRGAAVINIRFPRSACTACPCRDDCTHATKGGREITVRPEAEHLALHAARARQRTPAFQDLYNARAGVEGTHSQGLRRCGLRQARYVGTAKTHLQHLLIAVALNILRLAAWFAEQPRAQSRQSPFARMALGST